MRARACVMCFFIIFRSATVNTQRPRAYDMYNGYTVKSDNAHVASSELRKHRRIVIVFRHRISVRETIYTTLLLLSLTYPYIMLNAEPTARTISTRTQIRVAANTKQWISRIRILITNRRERFECNAYARSRVS